MVGVLTVPYPFRRVIAARDHFQYKFTREGTIYLVAAVLVGIASLNTANNLLVIILVAMLSGVWFSRVGSAANRGQRSLGRHTDRAVQTDGLAIEHVVFYDVLN